MKRPKIKKKTIHKQHNLFDMTIKIRSQRQHQIQIHNIFALMCVYKLVACVNTHLNSVYPWFTAFMSKIIKSIQFKSRNCHKAWMWKINFFSVGSFFFILMLTSSFFLAWNALLFGSSISALHCWRQKMKRNTNNHKSVFQFFGSTSRRYFTPRPTPQQTGLLHLSLLLIRRFPSS